MNEIETLTPAALGELRSTKPWVRLLSIVGFVVVAVASLIALLAVLGGAILGQMFMYAFAIQNLITATVWVAPSIALWRYASAIGRSTDTAGVEKALLLQNSFWKSAGIAAISWIAIWGSVMIAVRIWIFTRI